MMRSRTPAPEFVGEHLEVKVGPVLAKSSQGSGFTCARWPFDVVYIINDIFLRTTSSLPLCCPVECINPHRIVLHQFPPHLNTDTQTGSRCSGGEVGEPRIGDLLAQLGDEVPPAVVVNDLQQQ